jgi:hypothetical protein
LKPSTELEGKVNITLSSARHSSYGRAKSYLRSQTTSLASSIKKE